MRAAIASLVTLLLLASAAPASAQVYRGRENIAEAAHALSEDADRFAERLRSEGGFADVQDDARVFAARAERLHAMIEHGTRYQAVVARLDRLQDDHARLRLALLESMQRNYEGGLLSQWARVTYDLDRLIIETGVEPASSCTPDRRHGPRYDHRRYRPYSPNRP